MPPGLFLWGFLKERVDSNCLRSLDDLKHNIEQAVAGTDHQTLQNVVRNTVKSVNAHLQEGAGYFQHLLYLHISSSLSHS
jgi:hypothetical protein